MKYCNIVKKEIDELHAISDCKYSTYMDKRLSVCKLNNKCTCYKLTEIDKLKKSAYLGLKIK